MGLIVGFVWYAESINRAPQDTTTQTDAIVVLTGGRNRVEEGLRLLKKDLAKKLFISGVFQRVSVEDLKKKYKIDGTPSCCIELGYQARNTIGNAKETALWVVRNGFKSIRLVTSTYHMPRSLLEFKRYMPDIEIIPHPTQSRRVKQKDWWYWPGTLSLMIREYLKFLYVYIEGLYLET